MTMTRTIRRTLRERLFTLPWRPLKSTKEIPDPAMDAMLELWRASLIDRAIDPGRTWWGAPQTHLDVTTIEDEERRITEVQPSEPWPR